MKGMQALISALGLVEAERFLVAVWLSKRKGRSAAKAEKDQRQGLALLETIKERMPQFRLDEAFMRSLPEELREQIAAPTPPSEAKDKPSCH